MALFTSSNPSKKKKQVYLAKFTTKKAFRGDELFFSQSQRPPLRQVRQVRQVRQTKKRPFGTVSGQFCVVSFCLTCLNFSAGLIRKQQSCRFCVRLACLTCLSCSKTSKSTGFVFVSLVPFFVSLVSLAQKQPNWPALCLSHLSHLSHLFQPPPCLRSGSPHPWLDVVCQKHAKSGPSWANQCQNGVGRTSIKKRVGRTSIIKPQWVG